jgi:hypothetical protein
MGCRATIRLHAIARLPLSMLLCVAVVGCTSAKPRHPGASEPTQTRTATTTQVAGQQASANPSSSVSRSGETSLPARALTASERRLVGDWVLVGMTIDGRLELAKRPERLSFRSDGTLVGGLSGRYWTIERGRLHTWGSRSFPLQEYRAVEFRKHRLYIESDDGDWVVWRRRSHG